MTTTTDEIMNFIGEISEIEGLKCTVFESAKGGLITGAGAAIGGLLMGGPVGLVIGAGVGVATACATCNEFESVFLVIAKMSGEQKERLANRIRSIMQRTSARDVAALAAMTVATSSTLRNEVIGVVTEFMHQDMQRTVRR